jgi:hypothetical protein
VSFGALVVKKKKRLTTKTRKGTPNKMIPFGEFGVLWCFSGKKEEKN